MQGVERLDFIYGVQYRDASLHYLTADEVRQRTATLCELLAALAADSGISAGVVSRDACGVR